MPKRIQRKRTKGWRMPENAVYVGRPSKWGNPFTGQDAVEVYRKCVTPPVTALTLLLWDGDDDILLALVRRDYKVLEELRGKDLACWCPLDKPCHADVLLEIVNEMKAGSNADIST